MPEKITRGSRIDPDLTWDDIKLPICNPYTEASQKAILRIHRNLDRILDIIELMRKELKI